MRPSWTGSKNFAKAYLGLGDDVIGLYMDVKMELETHPALFRAIQAKIRTLLLFQDVYSRRSVDEELDKVPPLRHPLQDSFESFRTTRPPQPPRLSTFRSQPKVSINHHSSYTVKRWQSSELARPHSNHRLHPLHPQLHHSHIPSLDPIPTRKRIHHRRRFLASPPKLTHATLRLPKHTTAHLAPEPRTSSTLVKGMDLPSCRGWSLSHRRSSPLVRPGPTNLEFFPAILRRRLPSVPGPPTRSLRQRTGTYAEENELTVGQIIISLVKLTLSLFGTAQTCSGALNVYLTGISTGPLFPIDDNGKRVKLGA